MRLLLGEDSAKDIDHVLRTEFKAPPTVRDLRKKVNELMNKTHNDNAVNNWASHHPLGQKAVEEHLLARIKGRPKPKWWREGMPVAEHEVSMGTEVMVLHTSGGVDPLYDEAITIGENHLTREIAPRLAPGKQNIVVETANAFNICTERFNHANTVNELKDQLLTAQKEIIDGLRREVRQNAPHAPRLTVARRRSDTEEPTTRRAENANGAADAEAAD
jgi:hypothetical protein